MGFQDDGDFSDRESKTNELIEKQIAQNEAEIESKRKSLYDTRLSIIKSAGRENWTTSQHTPSPAPSPSPAPTPAPKPWPPRPKPKGASAFDMEG